MKELLKSADRPPVLVNPKDSLLTNGGTTSMLSILPTSSSSEQQQQPKKKKKKAKRSSDKSEKKSLSSNNKWPADETAANSEKISELNAVSCEKKIIQFQNQLAAVVPPPSKWENDEDEDFDEDKIDADLKQSMLNKLQKATATLQSIKVAAAAAEDAKTSKICKKNE